MNSKGCCLISITLSPPPLGTPPLKGELSVIVEFPLSGFNGAFSRYCYNLNTCKTEVFELLLPSAKVKQNNYGSGRYF